MPKSLSHHVEFSAPAYGATPSCTYPAFVLSVGIGFSFAVGVLVDAFVVRLTLVPAFMAILGARAWYHPHWFARNVPDPDIEGERLDEKLSNDPHRLAGV